MTPPDGRRNAHLPLLVILFGTLLLGLLYLFTVPPGYGPDEPSHFGYVRHVAEGRGFPVLGRDTDPQGPAYESHQPPLYYVLSVPVYVIGRAAAGERGAWMAVRFFSLLCGLVTVALVYLLVLRLFPGEPSVAAAAGAFAGWLPSQAALFAVVSNDPLTELGFTLAFYLLVRYLLAERPGNRLPLWIGLVAGLIFLIKSSALILLAVLPLALLLSPRRTEADASPNRFRPVLLFGLGALVCVPWLFRNQAVYGDPLGWRAFVEYFQNVMKSPTPHTLAEQMRVAYTPAWYWLEAVGGWAYRDSLGMWLFSRPGQPVPLRVTLPPLMYTLWGGLWIAALMGMIRFGLTEWREKPPAWRWGVAGMGLAFLLLLAAYLRLNAVFFWAHSRYLFPAVAFLALAWAAGLSRLAPPRYRPALLWGVNGVLFFIALFAGYAILGGYFEAAATLSHGYG